MSTERLDEETGELVRLVARFLRQTRVQADGAPPEIGDALRAHGLGPRHLSVLIALAVHGPALVGELAGHAALAPATTSQLVGELLRAGLVERRTDDEDRRRRVISIRHDLRSSVHALAQRRLAPLRATLARLSAPERAHFLHGWRILVDQHEQSDEKEHA